MRNNFQVEYRETIYGPIPPSEVPNLSWTVESYGNERRITRTQYLGIDACEIERWSREIGCQCTATTEKIERCTQGLVNLRTSGGSDSRENRLRTICNREATARKKKVFGDE